MKREETGYHRNVTIHVMRRKVRAGFEVCVVPKC
jgi:hypothetical protein